MRSLNSLLIIPILLTIFSVSANDVVVLDPLTGRPRPLTDSPTLTQENESICVVTGFVQIKDIGDRNLERGSRVSCAQSNLILKNTHVAQTIEHLKAEDFRLTGGCHVIGGSQLSCVMERKK